MGIYFNPDNASFRQAVRSEIYIDKTGLLEELNKLLFTESKCISLSHARRFGKSQAAGMIDAYYSIGSDSRELFSKFEIAGKPDFEEHLNKYNVIHIDMSSMLDFHKEDLVEYLITCLTDEFRYGFSNVDYSKSISSVISQIAALSGRMFVVIIDEWDCVIRNCSDDQELVHKYLQLLHTLFKSEESKSYLALAYITGILPIKKIKDESALNNFAEYTMIKSGRFTPYFGFTEEEVRGLCDRYNMCFDSVKQWYDGYRISNMDMYNPNSVYQAMVDHELDSYWKNTSAFDTINTYITLNYDGLKDDVLTMLEGGKARVDTLGFTNDFSLISNKDDALTALIHLGYLAYDDGKAYIPNYEVGLAYKLALRKSGWDDVAHTISLCDELLDETIEGHSDRVAEIISLAHETYSSILKYNDENSLSCCLTMAYFTAPAYYNMIRELPSGKGFADIVFIPRTDSGNKPAMVVELKYDKTVESAITQIKNKNYSGSLKGYGKEILLVGINYDPDTKKHQCLIESVGLYL